MRKWFTCVTAGDGLPQPMSHSKRFWTGWSSLRTGPPHGWRERPPQDSGVPEVSHSEHLRFYKEGPRHPKQSPRGGGFGSLNWQACDWTLLAFQQLRNFLVFLWGRPEATHRKHSASAVTEEGLESLTLCAGQSSPLRCWLTPGNLFWEFGSTSAKGRLPPYSLAFGEQLTMPDLFPIPDFMWLT